MAIKAGVYDCVLAIGVEKMYFELPKKDRGKSFEGFIAGTDVEETMAWIEKWKASEKAKKEKAEREAKEKGVEIKKDKSKKGHSIFMDFYAMGARMHMEHYGTTQRQLAVIAAKNHNNSVLNPLAQYTFPQTVEQVMQDREVAFPLTMAMCAPIGDGAAAAVIC
ncbi:MAG: thiolase family protein, partial [Deltaproteobacteria bacterium]|nr:thiolase family protein [Deltaproteobacteria bacterium]